MILKLRNLLQKHPFDWIGHFLLCFTIAHFGDWDYAAIVAVTIEATQIESGIWQKWDHLIDLVFDFAGILLAIILKIL